MMCTLKQRILVLLILSIFIIMGTTTANAQENLEIGYMDEEGNIIVPCEYSSTSNFVNGFGLVSKDNGISKTYSAVNTKGE
ncbi:MAG: WG repeat-containing protein, partial [Peptostreptococcaceae bacterium]|nr:WG repeat-containing protein [Peptostreptococcaceae bacterium]